MSEEVSGSNAPFDLDRLRDLVEMMEKHGLSEVSLQRGDEKWRLRRGPTDLPMSAVPFPVSMPSMAHAPVISPTSPSSQASPAESGLLVIKSPTVGTFYASPSPDDPPFVSVGARVESDTIVCVVEAMKVFNQIPAEIGGTIVEVLVNSGDSVEFGQPLFRVRPG